MSAINRVVDEPWPSREDDERGDIESCVPELMMHASVATWSKLLVQFVVRVK